MKPDDFEKRLQCQPLRQIPVEWREEILAEARVVGPRPSTLDSLARRSGAEAARPFWLSTLLWPHPKAWAGLAAVWIAIFAIHFATRDDAPAVAKAAPPSREVMMALRDQQKLLAELLADRSGPHEAGRPKPAVPQPHSERRRERTMTRADTTALV